MTTRLHRSLGEADYASTSHTARRLDLGAIFVKYGDVTYLREGDIREPGRLVTLQPVQSEAMSLCPARAVVACVTPRAGTTPDSVSWPASTS
jgi:hypothetical protein